MQVIKPNSKFQKQEHNCSVFLAGSIEMGAAEDWQKKIENNYININVTLYNPRRDDWDAGWTQEQSNPQFNQQVNWELNSLEKADVIFMYFSPETKSPISLLELGLYANSGKMIVCCPDGFWRKGNVDIVCSRYNIPVYNTLDAAIGRLRTELKDVK
jgi:hypothetical protein